MRRVESDQSGDVLRAGGDLVDCVDGRRHWRDGVIASISVTERTREIRRAPRAGRAPARGLFQFLTEAAVLTSVGGICSAFFWAAGSGWLCHFLTGFPVSLPMWSFALGIGFSATVGIVFGMYPAIRARAPRSDRSAAIRIVRLQSFTDLAPSTVYRLRLAFGVAFLPNRCFHRPQRSAAAHGFHIRQFLLQDRPVQVRAVASDRRPSDVTEALELTCRTERNPRAIARVILHRDSSPLQCSRGWTHRGASHLREVIPNTSVFGKFSSFCVGSEHKGGVRFLPRIELPAVPHRGLSFSLNIVEQSRKPLQCSRGSNQQNSKQQTVNGERLTVNRPRESGPPRPEASALRHGGSLGCVSR